MTTTASVQPLIYRKRAVLLKLDVSESTMRRWMAERGFPRPRQLGPRAVGWVASEVEAWLLNLPPALSNADDEA